MPRNRRRFRGTPTPRGPWKSTVHIVLRRIDAGEPRSDRGSRQRPQGGTFMTVLNFAGREAPASRGASRRGSRSGQARNGPNRRRYPRIPALVHCRPAGEEFFAQPLEPVDISFGGVRIHSHQEYCVGKFLRLDIFFPRVEPVLFTTEIMWVEPLWHGSQTRFDMGLAFVELNPSALKLLLSVLTSEGELVGSAHPRASQAPARVELSLESA